jgi:predicted nucleotidyltransferase
MTREQVDQCTILRTVAGSRMLGLNTPESDTDLLGIMIEPIEEAMGVGAPLEQWVNEKEQIQIYGLRKWIRLALKGNPSMISLLWVGGEALQAIDARGAQLQELAPKIVSRRAASAFLGYLQAQRQRLLGLSSNRGHGPMREVLIKAHGFDTKYAMHMLRLGMQGVELLETGKLTIPMKEEDRTYLLAVRHGEHDLQACLTRAGELEANLKDLFTSSPLPEDPDTEAVEKWMLRMYLRNWSAARQAKDVLEDAKWFNVVATGGLTK